MKTPCSVIRDLLPLYQDGVCSPESRQLVEEHLEECETCRAEWERMSAPIPTAHPQVEERTVAQAASSAWKRGRQRAFRKGFVIAAVLAAVTCLCMAILFSSQKPPFEFYGVLSDPTFHPNTESVSFQLSVDDGYPVSIVVDEDTKVFSPFDAYPGQALKDGSISTPLRVFVQLDQAPVILYEEEEETTAYHAKLVELTAYQTSDTLPLSDGTQVEVWQGTMESLYALPQGPVLLEVHDPVGPGQDEQLLQLPQEVQDRILDYYTQFPLAYDLQSELNRAYQLYLQWTSPHLFPAQVVRQTTVLSACAPNVLYFATTVDRYSEMGDLDQETSCTAFYKDSGEPVDLQTLFTCTSKTLIQSLLDHSDLVLPEQQPELVEAFRLDYLTFHPDRLLVTYPVGTLPSQEVVTGFYFPYDDAILEYMPAWAVPYAP